MSRGLTPQIKPGIFFIKPKPPALVPANPVPLGALGMNPEPPTPLEPRATPPTMPNPRLKTRKGTKSCTSSFLTF
ncbi:hypothetical protein COCSADRAFT_31778 [Bipolaris sorokiniana ND90Pr]|nr:uncharacterized protein COCSADRAFT_31778 [Bipolaris sorokiniana ND90Pr]EMD69006.1 hypothetical protein COCSADRAFT_31778 [Bipolaris sorokiniana ND90Pr]